MWKGTTAKRCKLATTFVLDGRFGHIQQISSSVEIIARAAFREKLIPKVTQSKTDFRFSLRFLLRCLSIASSANLIAVSLLNAVPVFVRISSRLMTHFQPVGLAV